jgi:hypothetical protein
MWKLLQKSAVAPLSGKVRYRLANERGLSHEDAAGLRMMEKSGRCAGRKVTLFRVFDPATVKATAGDVCHFGDLDDSGMIYSGHTESDGQVVLDAETSAISL